MPLFHYWQNFFRATFLGATLLTQSVFQFSWKKFMVIRALFLGPMNYKFAKKFLVFYKNFQFPGSRRQLEEKFEIFWKNQKTTFLLKKIFFSSMRYLRGIRTSPWWRNKIFPPTHWQGNDENADPHQSGLKIQVLLYKPKPPHFQVRIPWGCVNSHFLAIFHHIRPKKQHRRRIRTTYCLHFPCISS